MASVNQRNSKAVPGRRQATLLGDLADLFRILTQGLESYRPELHYMRGPGPKWHAKHDPAPAPAMTGPALARMG